MNKTLDINAFLKDAKGVIHVGASYGQERDVYADLNLPVIWVEAEPSVYRALKGNLVGRFSEQQALNYLVTDKDGETVDFHIACNQFSSSILEMKGHTEIWPDIKMIETVQLPSATLPAIIEKEQIDLAQFDTLILDVQGAELKVLEGAKDILKSFRFLRIETADFEIYEGCALDHQLDAFLIAYGFSRSLTWQIEGSQPGKGMYEILYESNRTRKNCQIIDPDTGKETWWKVGVLTSVPRLGFQIHDTVMHNAFGAKGWPITKVGGAFWEQSIQNGMNKMVELGCDVIITVDYDGIFNSADVLELLLMAAKHPEADAVAAWQAKRQGKGETLIGFKDEDGNFKREVPKAMLQGEVVEADHAVFGLTLIKTEALLRMPKPWFKSEPNANGEWLDGKTDADGYFWRKWKATGNTIFAANNAKIGHLEEFILWIDNEFNVIRQPLSEFYLTGRPF
jgi:FkbM family methyltransferase